MTRGVKLVQRIAVIRNPDPDAGTCQIEYLDRDASEPLETVELPHPYPAGTTGIFAVPNDGAFCVVGMGFMQKPIILSLINSSLVTAYDAQSFGMGFDAGYLPPPRLQQGEVLIKGSGTTSTLYSADGDIRNVFGSSNFVFDSDDKVTLKTGQSYSSTAAGYSVVGQISRETQTSRQGLTPADRLTDAAFDDLLQPIGRNPAVRVSSGGPGSPRNPPLTEARATYYEYSRDFDVYGPIQEGELLSSGVVGGSPVRFDESRQTARTNAFDIGPHSYNSLAETLIGTGVDIYGNLLDINRKAIKFDPALTLPEQLELLRRTIKLHVELNSRKISESISETSRAGPYAEAEPTRADHSRWYVDVDAEGQTKINVPASSPSGNIPLHLRYLPGSGRRPPVSQRYATDPNTPSSAEDLQDIGHADYGRGGVAVSPEYLPALTDSDGAAAWGMPYHDFGFADLLTDTAARLQDDASIDSQFQTITPAKQRYSDVLGGAILSSSLLENGAGAQNAGGRSLWANLDGSLELAIGCDQADRKSAVLDTAGSVIARLGADSLGNSAVLAADGRIRILSGVGSERQTGGFQLIVESGGFAATIEIDEGNIKIRSAPGKSIVLDSGDNLVLHAASNVLISAEQIGHYGKFSADGSHITPETLVRRNGTG